MEEEEEEERRQNQRALLVVGGVRGGLPVEVGVLGAAAVGVGRQRRWRRSAAAEADAAVERVDAGADLGGLLPDGGGPRGGRPPRLRRAGRGS